MVDRAPFSARFDSLVPGDLLGPFDGLVLDGETDRPVAGAVVAVSWAFERGVGLVGPFGAHEVVTETGADGRYRVSALVELPAGGSTRVRRTTMIIYKKGYVGWRSDRHFPTGTQRRDFSQHGNRVHLEKWRGDLLHHRHLVFLGGGAAVKSASAWEWQPASLELEGGLGVPGGGKKPAAGEALVPVLFDIKGLLSVDDLRGVTGYAGDFDVEKLSDLASTEFYDSRHFKARGKPESYDVGLRVWRLGGDAAELQFQKLGAELPGVVPSNEVGDAALRAKTAEVTALSFLSRDRGIVVSVSCGVAQCTEPGMVLRLAKLVEGHLDDLPPQPGVVRTGQPSRTGEEALPPVDPKAVTKPAEPNK